MTTANEIADQFCAILGHIKVIGPALFLPLDKPGFFHAIQMLGDVAFGNVHPLSTSLLIDSFFEGHLHQ